jgi:hypothetical protein
LTYLGNRFLDNEITNRIRLESYYKNRDKKIELKLTDLALPSEEFEEDYFEREIFLDRIRELFEDFSFTTELERNIAQVMVYGKMGDWKKLRVSSKLAIGKFFKVREKVIADLKLYLEVNLDDKEKILLKEFLAEE